MIRIYFGNIGCGKTTLAVRNFSKEQNLGLFSRLKARYFPSMVKPQRYDYYFANFENKLSNFSDLQKLGQWTFPEHTYLIVDEAGIEYNNRKFKSMPQETIAWFKLSRHYKCDVDFISQSWDDIDITIRRLASEYWYVKKLGPFTMLRRVYKRVGIDEVTHQIVDFYEFGKLWRIILGEINLKIFLRYPYYKYFDSYAKHELPVLDIS